MGEPFGTVHVDEIGVQLTLERWTGNAWVKVHSGSNTTVQCYGTRYNLGSSTVSMHLKVLKKWGKIFNLLSCCVYAYIL
jgi:hypothetical protein